MHLRYHLSQILKELVKRSGNPILEFATVDEVVKFFNKKPVDLLEISRRKNGYTSCLEKGKTSIKTGMAAEKLRSLVKEDLNEVEEFKGNIANKGVAIGQVRIISFTAEDYNKEVASFKNKEILVTGMTRPQIVHLCRKAAAIVTDEGGITSHAAVISREFNLPCIIATKNATKILRTGDTVEVDANNGVVKIIKRK